jgi:hypothetical protein
MSPSEQYSRTAVFGVVATPNPSQQYTVSQPTAMGCVSRIDPHHKGLYARSHQYRTALAERDSTALLPIPCHTIDMNQSINQSIKMHASIPIAVVVTVVTVVVVVDRHGCV